MKKELFGFTLVELLVGITISSLLMIGVSVLVSNGIQNITGQREIIKNSKSENSFYQDIIQKINTGDGKLFKKTGSGFLIKQKKDFSKGGFSYIGTKSLEGVYCTSTGSDFQNQDHITIKDFIPFEGEGGDYFDDIVYKRGSITVNYNEASLKEGATIYTGVLLGPTGVYETGSTIYIADTKGHKVMKYDAGVFEDIIGKGAPGHTPISTTGLDGTEVYLNSPTGITAASGGLFISDTLNDRIIRYEFGTLPKVYEYLGKKDGLSEPTGLYYDSVSKKLFIANAGKGEILAVSQSESFPSDSSISILFSPEIATNINNIQVSFFSGSLSSPVSITFPTNESDVTFSSISKGGEDFILTGTGVHYYFTQSFSASETAQLPHCNGGSFPRYVLNAGGSPVKCTQSGTGVLSSFDNKSLVIGGAYQINISALNGAFSGPGNYYARIQLLNNSNMVREKMVSFYTSGDNNINSIEDNTIEKFATGLMYPTGIYMNGPNLFVNDFFERKEYKYNPISGNILSTNNLQDFDFNNLPLNAEDIVFSNPIENFDVIEDTNLLTFKGKYYNDFSCIDGAKKGGTDFLFKKNLSD